MPTIILSQRRRKFTQFNINKASDSSKFHSALIAFSEKKREIGVAANNQRPTNIRNTIYNFKNLLGSNIFEWPSFNFNDCENDINNEFVYEINCSNERQLYKPVQLAQMLFAKLKNDALASLEATEIFGCVLAYPSYFSPLGKKQLLLAAGLAGLNCHFIIKETTAVAIDYAFYKKFPRPKHVVFVDFGASSIQISACRFTETKLEVLSEVSGSIGGRDFDELLAQHIIKKLNLPVLNMLNADSVKFFFKLLTEVEKAKKKMSIDTIRMPLNMEPFIADCESLSLDRQEMDEVCNELYRKAEDLMEQCLAESTLDVTEIDAVEIVGGSTRVPAVKELIKKVFKKFPSTTMNQDEAVARGCRLRHIMSTKRRDFEIVEKELPGVETDHKDYITIGEVSISRHAS